MHFAMEFDNFQRIYKVKSSSCSKMENGKVRCGCDDVLRVFEWHWKKDSNSTNLLLNSHDLEVTFNPVYSSGTAVIKGSNFLQKNVHYYWEIKLIENIFGTDVMIGVGTEKIPDNRHVFSSLLGIDEQSWGYSYRGIIQHNKLTRKYGTNFKKGCTIGVHLDMYRGKLEYYLDKKPQGVAFDGLKDKKLLPMACSTAAQSSMKLNCAISQEETLQMLCLKCVQQHSTLYEIYRTIPGLYRYYDRKYFWMVPKDFTEVDPNEEDEQLHLISFETNKKKLKTKRSSNNKSSENPNKKVTIDGNIQESSSFVGHFVKNSTSPTQSLKMEDEEKFIKTCELFFDEESSSGSSDDSE